MRSALLFLGQALWDRKAKVYRSGGEVTRFRDSLNEALSAFASSIEICSSFGLVNTANYNVVNTLYSYFAPLM